MGRQYAEGLKDTNLTLEQQISTHFAGNCYPPIPQIMLPVAIEAINKCNSGEGHELIKLPAHVTWQGEKQVSAYNAIESLRLEAWCSE